MIIGCYQVHGEAGGVVWGRCIVAMIDVVLVCWFSSLFRWKLFLRRTDSEAWHQIYKLILNRVPNATAVINLDGKITYSNHEFHKLCPKEFRLFSDKLIHLKRRRIQAESEEIALNIDSPLVNPSSRPMLTKFTACEPRSNAILEKTDNLTILLEQAKYLLKEGEEEKKIIDGDFWIFDGDYTIEDNKKLTFEVTLSFMTDYQAVILILRDTTDHARLIALESNNNYKDRLLASVSHELRTPLNGNLSLIEAANHHKDIPKEVKVQYLVPAYRSGRLLLHLINDILDFSQITAQKLRLNYESVSLRDALSNCYQLLGNSDENEEYTSLIYALTRIFLLISQLIMTDSVK